MRYTGGPMKYFIIACKVLFVLFTIPIIFAAIASFDPGASHLVGLAWIAIAMACLGVITTWRQE